MYRNETSQTAPTNPMVINSISAEGRNDNERDVDTRLTADPTPKSVSRRSWRRRRVRMGKS